MLMSSILITLFVPNLITLISYQVVKMIVSSCFACSSQCPLPFSGIWLVNRVHLIQVVFGSLFFDFIFSSLSFLAFSNII